jgi:adenosylcobinamide-phosphate synthase
VAWIGRALGAGRRRLARGSPSRLLVSGALLTLVVTALAAGAGWMVTALSGSLGALGLLVEALALKSMLSARGLAEAARAVARDLDHGDLAAARASVGRHLVSRPTAGLDESHVASAAIESVAENLTDAVVAPLLYYVALGLPGVVAYRAVNTADAMIGYREGVLEHFGKVAARLDDLLNLIPARLAAAALVVAAALTGADARRGFHVMRRDHGRTASPNAGWTMAAMAGALGLVLEKPGHYRLGEGRLPAPDDIPQSVRVMAVAALLTAVVVALVEVMVR